jgi:hypothetical protein
MMADRKSDPFSQRVQEVMPARKSNVEIPSGGTNITEGEDMSDLNSLLARIATSPTPKTQDNEK